jgi:hypothetical protein
VGVVHDDAQSDRPGGQRIGFEAADLVGVHLGPLAGLLDGDAAPGGRCDEAEDAPVARHHDLHAERGRLEREHAGAGRAAELLPTGAGRLEIVQRVAGEGGQLGVDRAPRERSLGRGDCVVGRRLHDGHRPAQGIEQRVVAPTGSVSHGVTSTKESTVTAR